MNQAHEMSSDVERFRRRSMLGWLVAAVLAVATVGVWSQTPPPQRLTAEEFVIVDPATGQTRAILAFETGVGPSLQLFNDDGALQLRLGVSSSGPSVAYVNKSGEVEDLLDPMAGVRPLR